MASYRPPGDPSLSPPTASEAAFEQLLLAFGPKPTKLRDDGELDERTRPGRAAFLERLFANSAQYVKNDRFASIGEAAEFFTKIVGVTFEGRQDIVAGLAGGTAVELVREPINIYDSNAVAIYFGSLQLGYLRREIAQRLAPLIDGGERYRAQIASITGGGERSVGVNLLVRRDGASQKLEIPLGSTPFSRANVLTALIGELPLRDAQREVLARVEAGHNTLAILGTGRGKSLCFQYPAAVHAIERGAKTVVLYPLRALANDQYEALVRRLGPLGIRILRANGAIDSAERATLMDALGTGAWDIICSTPEFFGFHLDRFRPRHSRPALVVVDEAHHVFESRHRPAYGRIGTALAQLGSPQVLALTATAADDVFTTIVTTLGIDHWVIDPTVRSNLTVIDAREVTNKVAYISEHVCGPGKSIVYCNSRSEATKLAETLRRSVRDVAFYHAGVPSADRTEIERLFRANEVRVIVATSAFGEGIDLPDIRNVFLYHLNFHFTEFNQQAGRAGRDGADAYIHLVFGKRDRRLNDFILERSAPTLYTLRAFYRESKRLAVDGILRMTHADLASTLDLDKVDATTVSSALRIFSESGLVDFDEDDDGRYIRFVELTGKVDLTVNSRFAEGEAEREAFDRFCSTVLDAQANVLQNVINRPIYPINVVTLR